MQKMQGCQDAVVRAMDGGERVASRSHRLRGSIVHRDGGAPHGGGLLSDPSVEVSRPYGMADDTEGRILPGVVILDSQGPVRALFPGRLPPASERVRLVRETATGL